MRRTGASQGLGMGPNSLGFCSPKCTASQRQPLAHRAAKTVHSVNRSAAGIGTATLPALQAVTLTSPCRRRSGADRHLPQSIDPTHALRHVLAGERGSGDVLDVRSEAKLIQSMAAVELM